MLCVCFGTMMCVLLVLWYGFFRVVVFENVCFSKISIFCHLPNCPGHQCTRLDAIMYSLQPFGHLFLLCCVNFMVSVDSVPQNLMVNCESSENFAY